MTTSGQRIQFTCPHCQVSIRAAIRKAGTTSACPKCHQLIQVPASSVPVETLALTSHPTTATPEDEGVLPVLEAVPAGDGRNYPVALSSQRIRLTGLAAAAFQHPLDQQATASLKAIKGFDWLVGKFIEYGVERAEYVTNIGSNIRVGPRQLSKIYGMLQECCAILEVAEPELYVKQGIVNAFTSGHNNPYIILQTALLDVMNDDEIMAVIAHELGHIKCGHVLYWTMARLIGPLMAFVGQMTMGLGSILGAGIETALLAWQRTSELSADRAALLTTQDPRPCVSMLMKLSGGTRRWELDPEQFLNQARSYGEGLDQSNLDRVYRFLGRGGTHPPCVERARALDEWITSREYRALLAGTYRDTTVPSDWQCCPTCSIHVEHGVKFCPKCGTPLRTHGAKKRPPQSK